MRTIDKYIAKQIILSIMLVALALVGIDLFFSLVNELRVVGKGTYTLSSVFIFLSLTTPSHLYTIFPWAALLGSIICLGLFASHSELVILRSSGLSVGRIAWSVVKGALVLMVFVMFLGEVVAPITERLAQQHRTNALTGGNSLQTPFGLWVRQDEAFIHVQTVRKKGRLEGVTRYLFDEAQSLKEIQFADRADYNKKEGWHLMGIKGTRFFKDRTETFQMNQQHLKTLLEPAILETAAVKYPDRLSIITLWRTISHRAKHELDTQAYSLAFWSKILKPLVIVLMVALGVPFVFGPLRSVSMGVRILTGILIGFTFHTLNSLLGPLALVYQVSAFFAVFIPLLLFGGLGAWMMQRVR